MRPSVIPVLLFFIVQSAQAQFSDPGLYPTYGGKDLGLTHKKTGFTLRIWAPTATEAEWIFYADGEGGTPLGRKRMTKDLAGTWTGKASLDRSGQFYTLRVRINGIWSEEVIDPYAKAVGVNGKRAQLLDLRQTDPVGWALDRAPDFHHKTDALIYELHIRDASIHPSSGIRQRGKFLGLTESGTKNPGGLSTGLDHLVEMGITHVHLLPIFDFNSVDERDPDKRFNWGYDPLNYNVPEGSYSTNPDQGAVRIREFKQLVQSLHQHGIRVVMDVVYNHTALTEKSNFNQLVPGYYYRQNEQGGFSNASACGNETASDRPMFRKFMLESMRYWVQEYHVDGFRVDLMGIHDIETMNLISAELHRIKPDVLLYGEGWTAGSSPLPESKRAIKGNAYLLDRIAVFSDDIRDGIKGSVFEQRDRGFISGKSGTEQSLRCGVVASLPHPQVDFTRVSNTRQPYAGQPHHTITYAECHDNHVLRDKLELSAPEATDSVRAEMHRLALGILLTSQGIVFLHAGTEFRRSKCGVENSFESPDSINAIDWSNKSTYFDFYQYTRSLIQLRKAHPAFRFREKDQVLRSIVFDPVDTSGVVSFQIDASGVQDPWKRIWVRYQGGAEQKEWKLGPGWKAAILNNRSVFAPGEIRAVGMLPRTLQVLYQ